MRRCRTTLASWQVVELTADIAESAARLRIALRMKLPDAIQAASALAIGADALVTHESVARSNRPARPRLSPGTCTPSSPW